MCTRIPHRRIRATLIGLPCLLSLLLTASCVTGAVDDTKTARYHKRIDFPSTSRRYCGIDSLYVCCQHSASFQGSIAEMERRINVTSEGSTAEELVAAASSFGCRVTPVQATLDQVLAWNQPAVLHVNGKHFISFLGGRDGRMWIFDNSAGLYDCDRAWFDGFYKFDGTTLVLGAIPQPWFLWLSSQYFIPACLGLLAIAVLARYTVFRVLEIRRR
jgi:hypothetical protein